MNIFYKNTHQNENLLWKYRDRFFVSTLWNILGLVIRFVFIAFSSLRMRESNSVAYTHVHFVCWHGTEQMYYQYKEKKREKNRDEREWERERMAMNRVLFICNQQILLSLLLNLHANGQMVVVVVVWFIIFSSILFFYTL